MLIPSVLQDDFILSGPACMSPVALWLEIAACCLAHVSLSLLRSGRTGVMSAGLLLTIDP